VFPSAAFAHRNYRIDWILLRGDLSCGAAQIDVRRGVDTMPSDHYPVVASLDWLDGTGATPSL
jgi:endonuclease/exonuclease/phosphatase family metal-dependent hydrolase